ncbi:hypothetical protein EYF80_054382 [Liparis tanakae]|uniref:Uncharacterized protein n=1 Tax=Liparis tanakae TaxID=230148 RepID=A0A4Z2F2K1_9TELE|nr:hypothetical protein EYF80_054382 [Liparis tanakae]
MASYLLCWGGGALEDRYLYAPPYPAVYSNDFSQMVAEEYLSNFSFSGQSIDQALRPGPPDLDHQTWTTRPGPPDLDDQT